MLTHDDIELLKRKRLCSRCVGEAFLKSEIDTKGKRATCSFCKKIGKCFTIEEISNRVETAFDQHYIRTSDQPTSLQLTMLSDRESDYDWERDGEAVVDAIMNAADIPYQAADDIQKILEEEFADFDSAAMGEETKFSSESYYEEKGTDDARWQEEWAEFERSLKTEARFFSRTGARLLASIFDGIELMRTSDGKSMVVDAGPNTSLTTVYRARVFQSSARLEEALARPNKDIGSPPSIYANAGRMNARGISIFYGANNPKVALAEVRPPVGSQVAVARFEIIRPIRLLDLTALSDVTTSGSIFDPSLNDRLERTMFLRNLSARITVPVMPDDEIFEYLPTQAIADFLATEATTKIDGIIFPSVQAKAGALNVALFHKAARVENIVLPKGTEVSATVGQFEEEGWVREYTVFEHVPRDVPKKKQKATALFQYDTPHGVHWGSQDPDGRPFTLKIDLASLKVHIVEAVEFRTQEYDVHRHRIVKQNYPFLKP